jgi:hypothetical protein
VLDESQGRGLANAGFHATGETIDEAVEVLRIRGLYGIPQAVSDVDFRGVAGHHLKP